MNVPTHLRVKSGKKVFVERVAKILVVRSLTKKVLGSYTHDQMALFHKRYKPLKKSAE